MFSNRRSILAGLALVAATPAAMAQAQRQARSEMAASPMMSPADVKTASARPSP